MSDKKQRRFMAPDDPTAVYPIGMNNKKDPVEDYEEKQAAAKAAAKPQPASPPAKEGIDPLVAAAIVGAFVVLAVMILAILAAALVLL